jgi:hypothetical protein
LSAETLLERRMVSKADLYNITMWCKTGKHWYLFLWVSLLCIIKWSVYSITLWSTVSTVTSYTSYTNLNSFLFYVLAHCCCLKLLVLEQLKCTWGLCLLSLAIMKTERLQQTDCKQCLLNLVTHLHIYTFCHKLIIHLRFIVAVRSKL